MNSPKRLARIAGVLYLLVGIFGGFAEGYVEPKMYVAGDAAATAGNVVANAGLVRLGVVSDLLDQTFFVFLALTLYILLKHVHKSVARAMVVLVALAAGISSLNAVFEFAGLAGRDRCRRHVRPGHRGVECHGAAPAGHPALRVAHRADLLRPVAGAAGLSRPQVRLVPQGLGRRCSSWPAAATCVDLLAAFLVPDFGQLIHTFIVIPCAIAEIWMVGYLLAIGVRTVKSREAGAQPRRSLNGLQSGGGPYPAAAGSAIDSDDDIADLLPGLDVAVGLDDLVQRIGPVDDRLELARTRSAP